MRRHRIRAAVVALGFGGLVVWSVAGLGLDMAQVFRGWSNLRLFWDRAMPPDGSVLPPALGAMVETLQMAFLGTFLALFGALPLALGASRNLFGGAVGATCRVLLAAFRTLPAILWALVLVALVGLGVLAGVLALALYTVGFLGKLQYEAIEGLPQEPVHALQAIGASRLQVIRHVVVPEMANSLLSHVLFAFEYNVRHGAVLGVVGAGGIGTLMMSYLTFFQLDRLFAVLAVVFATVLLIDSASRAVRQRFTEGVRGRVSVVAS